jgi:hypothetical protein
MMLPAGRCPRSGRGRFADEGELLRRSGVLDSGGRPIVAGILALGAYPQQWFPRLVIQAAAEPLPGSPEGIRALNQLTIDGPIPRMLDKAMDWARPAASARTGCWSLANGTCAWSWASTPITTTRTGRTAP